MAYNDYYLKNREKVIAKARKRLEAKRKPCVSCGKLCWGIRCKVCFSKKGISRVSECTRRNKNEN